MKPSTSIIAMVMVVAIAAPRRAGAQPCDPRASFYPQAVTTMVAGYTLFPGWAVFRSPENVDPTLVWHVGDPVTLNGCIGGIAPGSGAPIGQLEIQIDFLFCFGVDVMTTTPYTADLYDPAAVLVSSVTGSAPSVDLPFRSETLYGYRVVLTPGMLAGGGRDALCVDNMRAIYGEVPVRARTWGSVKTIYR